MQRISAELGFRTQQGYYPTSETEVDSFNWVTTISGIMTFSTGIFLTIVRLYEPLFRVLLLRVIYQFFG